VDTCKEHEDAYVAAVMATNPMTALSTSGFSISGSKDADRHQSSQTSDNPDFHQGSPKGDLLPPYGKLKDWYRRHM
jgi:hypothetical protein